jgi:aspartyl protease family protein
VNNLLLAFVGLAVAGTPLPAVAQAVRACPIGQQVTDDRGTQGTVVSARGDQCLIKYNDGQTHGWAPLQTLRAAAPATSNTTSPATPPEHRSDPPSGDPLRKNAADAVAIFRPEVADRIVFHADPRGHVLLMGTANGAPVRFMVDTGASLVILTPDDAQAAGIRRSELVFDHTVQTGNGSVRAALVLLRDIGIGGFSMPRVQAAVIDSMGQSVLGMSFLGRLKGFAMRDGVLTIDW